MDGIILFYPIDVLSPCSHTVMPARAAGNDPSSVKVLFSRLRDVSRMYRRIPAWPIHAGLVWESFLLTIYDFSGAFDCTPASLERWSIIV